MQFIKDDPWCTWRWRSLPVWPSAAPSWDRMPGAIAGCRGQSLDTRSGLRCTRSPWSLCPASEHASCKSADYCLVLGTDASSAGELMYDTSLRESMVRCKHTKCKILNTKRCCWRKAWAKTNVFLCPIKILQEIPYRNRLMKVVQNRYRDSKCFAFYRTDWDSGMESWVSILIRIRIRIRNTAGLYGKTVKSVKNLTWKRTCVAAPAPAAHNWCPRVWQQCVEESYTKTFIHKT